ncbi:MAG: class B sortase [Oscillospiraceae bacterium]|jgi:sortase B|nr:class B sortase [Oscillospiraceae bacterium]
MNTHRIGKLAIKGANSTINIILLTVILVLLAFAGYALWDSKQIYLAADKSNYAIYKPTVENEGKSFRELQEINSEIFAWLSVYGTNIDYPVTQGQDNMKYVNTNAEGLYSLSGSIFLDFGNSRDFSDFNSIIYGHHMEKKAMFGEIGNFAEKGMFDNHMYGNLYFDGKDHGIVFFAFVHTNAYDGSTYSTNVTGQEARQIYLDNLLTKSIHKREIGVTTEDHIVLLSTCSSSSTNGRDILVGKITDEVYPDMTIIPATDVDVEEQTVADSEYCLVKGLPLLALLLIVVLIILLVICIVVLCNRRKKKKERKKAV